MPNIEQVNAGPGALQVPERGSDAYAQMGRRVGSFYHQIGEDIGGTVKTLGDQYVEHQTNLEVSHLYAATTTAEQGLETAWQSYSNDPANKGRPDLAASYMNDHVKPVLEELASHAQTETGKRLAAEEVARVSQNIFHRTVADQSSLDAATWHNNALQTMSNLSAGADLSNMDQRIGDWMRVADATMPSSIAAGERAGLSTQFHHEGSARVVASAYLNSFEAIKQGLAAGQDTTAAEATARAAITAQRGFQYLDQTQQNEMGPRLDAAVASGKELHHQGLVVANEQMKQEGAANYAQIDTALTDAITSGSPPTPAMRQAIDGFAQRYGASNPGEVHALNEAWAHATTAEQEHRLQRTDPNTWADIQSRVALAPTDPRALTDADLANAWSAGKLSTEDYKLARELRTKTSEDPAMKATMAQFKSWQDRMISGIPTGNRGRGVAAAIFQHDSMQTFMEWIQSGETPGSALEIMSNPNNPRNFMQRFKLYQNASNQSDPARYISSHDDFAQHPPAVQGSPTNPVWPTTQAGTGAPGTPGTSSGTFNDGTANARTIHLQPGGGAPTPLSQDQVDHLLGAK